MDACDSAPPSPLLGDRPLEQNLHSSHPQWSAHTGYDGGPILKSTHIYKPEACLPHVWEVPQSRPQSLRYFCPAE